MVRPLLELAKRINVSEEVAQSYIDAFLETYPGVADYMKDRNRQRSMCNQSMAERYG